MFIIEKYLKKCCLEIYTKRKRFSHYILKFLSEHKSKTCNKILINRPLDELKILILINSNVFYISSKVPTLFLRALTLSWSRRSSCDLRARSSISSYSSYFSLLLRSSTNCSSKPLMTSFCCGSTFPIKNTFVCLQIRKCSSLKTVLN